MEKTKNFDSITLLGDVCLSNYENIIKLDDTFSIFDGVKEIFVSSAVFANLECVFPTEGAKPNLNKFSLKAAECLLPQLKVFDGLCLANNHIEDYGIRSVLHTQKLLENTGIPNFGYGNDINQARAPYFFEMDGKKIAILSYSCLTTNGENYAGQSRPGVAALAPEYVSEDSDKARKLGAELVIVSIHWGIENTHYPTEDQIAVAHRIIDEGADFIWGHHSHSIQGMELYKDRWITYGLGNFLFTDISIEVSPKGTVKEAVLKQEPQNLESIGIKLGIDHANNSFEIKQKYFFSNKNSFLPVLQNSEQQSKKFDLLCKNINKYVSKKSFPPKARLEIRKHFNGHDYQNVYINPSIYDVT